MPHSGSQGKDWALARYLDRKPGLVLDVGAGAGTYARLMRPHHGSYWTGVEAWGPYVDEYSLNDLYDRVIIADARHVCWHRLEGSVDMAIAGDVLEHMGRQDAFELIDSLKAVAKTLLVSIPVLHLDQGAVNGNPFETHVDHWTFDAMADALGSGLTDTWRGDVLAYYWWTCP